MRETSWSGGRCTSTAPVQSAASYPAHLSTGTTTAQHSETRQRKHAPNKVLPQGCAERNLVPFTQCMILECIDKIGTLSRVYVCTSRQDWQLVQRQLSLRLTLNF